jgi:hypothetical protein
MLDEVLFIVSGTAQFILVTTLALILAYALSWAVGSGWRRGYHPTPKTPTRPVHRARGPVLPSPRKASRDLSRQGGICGYGHYVPSDRPVCVDGHEWNVQATLDAGASAVERARQKYEMEQTRLTAGGW